MPTVTVKVTRSFYDRSYGMKFRQKGDTFEESPVRAEHLRDMGLVTIVADNRKKKNQAAAEK